MLSERTSAEVVPLDKITQIMAQLFIKLDMYDLQIQALCLGQAVELFRHLQRHERQWHAWEGLVRQVTSQAEASGSSILSQTQTPAYSLFKTLNAFLAQLTPIISFRHTLSAKPEDLLRHAFLWELASRVHEKVKTKCDSNRSSSIVLASKILEACGGKVKEALSLLTSIAHIEDHDELQGLTDFLADCKRETNQAYPGWYSSQYGHLPCAVNKTAVENLKIKLTLGYVLAKLPITYEAEKLHRLALDLHELLHGGVCTYQHFLKLGLKWKALTCQNVASISRMLRNYSVKGLPENIFSQNAALEDFEYDVQYQPLPSLLKCEVQEESQGSGDEEFIKVLCDQNPSLGSIDQKYFLDVLAAAQSNISPKDASAILSWSAKVRNQKLSTPADALEFVSIVQSALQLLKGWTLTTVQILSIYLAIIVDGGNCKLFQQVSTGLGKSLIIAVLAVKKALEGSPVDIYTSNAHLAARDSNDWSKFFALFGLRCDHNGEEEGRLAYPSGKKACYKKEINIVYGDVREFEIDALRSDYLSLKTRAGRAYGFAIVDEVDSSYIDDAAKLTILSVPIAGMELLQPLYHHTCKYLLALNSTTNILQVDSSFFVFEGRFVSEQGRRIYISPSSCLKINDDDIRAAVRNGNLERLSSWGIHNRRSYIKENLEKFITKLITGCSDGTASNDPPPQRIKIPGNLKEFVKSQVVHWAEAAIVAHTLQEMKDYVLVNGRVAPIDPSNGATQHKSSWSNGVQQFLQVKHSLRFTPQTLMTAFMSHKSMLEKYKDGLFGITGTLGNEATIKFLHSLKIKTVLIPDLYNNKLLRVFPTAELAADKADWMLKIKESIEEELKGSRAVLVICSSIRSANKLRDYLANRISKHNGVHLYARSDEEETFEEDFRNIRAEPRSIYIMTLLGARGMDVRPIGMEEGVGIHVILTFLLPNGRVEKQAFGRTARQGFYGSVQYILKKAPKGSTGTTTYTSISDRMNAAEDEQLGVLGSQVYPGIGAKDEAFEEYRKCFTLMHQGFLSTVQEGGKFSKAKGKVWGRTLSDYDLSLLSAYEEYWALHFALRSDLVQLSGTPTGSSMDIIKMALKDFKRPTTAKVSSAKEFNYRRPEELFELTRSCFHPTRYAFQFYADSKCLPLLETIPDAKRYFELAVTYDSEFSAGASLGLAYISLIGDKKGFLIPTNAPGYKDEAITNLTRCLAIFSEELCQFQGLLNHVESQRNDDDPLSSEYEVQLRARLQVLHHFGAVVYKTLDFVKLSFRKAYLVQLNPSAFEETRIQIPVSCTRLPWPNIETNRRVTLECEGLNWKKDLQYYHQAKSAIKFLTGQKDAGLITKMRFEAGNAAKFFEFLAHDTLNAKNTAGLLGRRGGSILTDIEFRVQDLMVANALDASQHQSSRNLYALRITNFPEDFAEPIKMGFEAAGGEGVQLWRCRHQQCDSEGSELELEPDLEEQEVRGQINSEKFQALFQLIAGKFPIANVVIQEFPIPAIPENQSSLLKKAQKVWVHVPIDGALELLKFLKKIDMNPHSVQFTNLPTALAKKTIKLIKYSEDPIIQVAFRPFSSLFFNSQSPAEIIQEMKMRGLHWVAAFEELDSLRPATTAILAVQFFVEFAAGALLTCTGIGGIFAQPFYAAAVYDICALAKTRFLRKFSWTAYCLAKPLSLASSLGLVGLDALASGGTSGTPFFDRILNAFSSISVFTDTVAPSLLDASLSLVASLAGPLADHTYQQERSWISEKVEKVVLKYLEEKPEMQTLLASFCALERLEHGSELLSITSTSELQFRLWLDSTGLGVAKSWTSKLTKFVELWLTQQGIKNMEPFKGLTLAGILLRTAQLIRSYEALEEITMNACSVIQKMLVRILTAMQDLSSVLVNQCGLSHEQVRKLGIKPGREFALPKNADGLDFISTQQLSHSRERLKRLKELQSSLAPVDQSILLASLSDFLTDHIVGSGAKAIISAAWIMQEPRRQKTKDPLAEAEEQHCVVIASQDVEKDPVPTVKVSTTADKSHEKSQALLNELMNLCANALGPVYSSSRLPARPRLAAIQLAQAMFYSYQTGRKISVIEECPDSGSSSPPVELLLTTSTLPVLLFLLNPERTEVASARLSGEEKNVGRDCALRALGARSGSVIIRNSLSFHRLTWLIDHLITFAPSASNMLEHEDDSADG